MCGIVGEISTSQVDISRFKQMRDELSHRGPDGTNLYTNGAGSTVLGFRRLAIIDLSDDGMQPMENEDETVYLLFNGEIYNFQTLRSELKAAGHTFSSETDSEVILHGYEEWGTSVIERLRGMFAFAIWDEKTDQLFMARDPFGIKPLYYYHDDDRFVFASELKAILADERIPREISRPGIHSYLKYGYIPAPLTIWKNISKVVPGEYTVYDGSTLEAESYWSPEEHIDTQTPSVDDATADLESRLGDSVDSHLVSDVPLGVLLSGGVDSSTIAALASDSLSDLSAFSMGFEDAPDELAYSRQVAELFDLNYTESVLSPEKLDSLLDDILYFYDEPLADSSIFPTFLLMQEVSDEFKVALGGDGGDELFAGYNWYDTYMLFKRFNRFAPFFSLVGDMLGTANDRLDSSALQSAQWRAELAGLEGMEQYLSSMKFSISDGELETILDGQLTNRTDEEPIAQYATNFETVKDIQCFDMRTFLPSILMKIDRASMGNSLEVRVPFLDREVAEYSLSLSDDLHYGDGEKKHLLKRVARNHLPDEIVDRPKSGFGAPLGRLSFFEQKTELLADSKAAADGVFDQAGLDQYLDQEPRDHNLFKLIMFELWYRRWSA